jgi:hypothetical protein
VRSVNPQDRLMQAAFATGALIGGVEDLIWDQVCGPTWYHADALRQWPGFESFRPQITRYVEDPVQELVQRPIRDQVRGQVWESR